MTETQATEQPSRPVLTEANIQAIHAISRPAPRLLTHYLIRSLPALPIYLFLIWPQYIRYKTLRYKFTDEGVTASWGRWWRKEIYLTYRRIQDIHISRGLVQRWLGLGTIHIQTASGKSEPELSIEGILEFEKLRDFLYSKTRGAKPPESRMVAPGAEASDDGELVTLLGEIRDELRGIRQTIESQRP